MKLSVVIPCFNERGTIREILSRVERVVLPAGWEKEIVVVDDCSTDGTREILKDYEERHVILYHAKNSGKGVAVSDGLARATGDYLLIQDADLEYNPADIPAMIAAIENDRDVIYGSREMGSTRRRKIDMPRVGVLGMTWFFNLLFGTRITDIWTCYKLFPRSAAPLYVPGRFESDGIFSAALVRHGYRAKEVPISYSARSFADGKKVKYRDGLYALALIVKYWAFHLPRVLLLPLGACLFAMALTFSVTGLFNDRIDTAIYVSQIEAFQTFVTGNGMTPALATFKPLPAVIGGFLSFIMHPYIALLLINLALYLGFIFAMYGMLRELSFERVYAAIGASWVALSYPILKYGLALGTDEWGWCTATLVVMMTLNAVRTERRYLLFFASIIGFLGSLAKETAVLGLLFAGLYLLSQVRVWGIRETVRWLVLLCAPFFILQALFLGGIIFLGGPTFLDWFTWNTAEHTVEYHRLDYFIGVMFAAFNVLLVYAGIGVLSALRSGSFFTAAWLRTNGLLVLATVPVLLWPMFISRVLFILALPIIPLALTGIRVFSRHPRLTYALATVPPLASIGLFLLSGNEALYAVILRLL